jgi:hypothetical protein
MQPSAVVVKMPRASMSCNPSSVFSCQSGSSDHITSPFSREARNETCFKLDFGIYFQNVLTVSFLGRVSFSYFLMK